MKADKRQREVLQNLSEQELLEMLLRQLSQRALHAELASESFGIQQQLHQALAKLAHQAASLKPAQQRNLEKLMTRMSWWQLMQVAKKSSCVDPAFIEEIQKEMASLKHGTVTQEHCHAKSFWL